LQVSTTEFEMHPVHYLQVSQVLSWDHSHLTNVLQ
jgi:hypothetical protein